DSRVLRGAADDQVFAEVILLKLFIASCDRGGIALPGDGYEFRKAWMDDQRGQLQTAYLQPERWPFDAHLPLLAFAQHHGIPTRLLDWTRNATVAAYFAASDAIGIERSGDLAIWALNIEFLHVYPGVALVPMPGANSARLAAQKGLFTLVKENGRRDVIAD